MDLVCQLWLALSLSAISLNKMSVASILSLWHLFLTVPHVCPGLSWYLFLKYLYCVDLQINGMELKLKQAQCLPLGVLTSHNTVQSTGAD